MSATASATRSSAHGSLVDRADIASIAALIIVVFMGSTLVTPFYVL